MTFSYDSDDLVTELNKIRLWIGDVDEDDAFLQDEEIAYVQDDSSTFLKRVAACCRLICAKIARKVDYKLSLLTEQASKIYDRYKAMAVRFEAGSSRSYPWTGSVDVALKKANEDDTSLVKPKIRKGLMDYRGSNDND